MKKVFVIIFAILLLGIITSCEQLEDTNGDSTQLQSITMEELSGTSVSVTASGVSLKSTRNNFTILSVHDDIDVDRLKRSGGPSSGMDNIMATYLDVGDEFRIESYCMVESGNFVMILLSPNNDILHEFVVGGNDSFEMTAITEGEYIVRIGVESFVGDIELERFFD